MPLETNILSLIKKNYSFTHPIYLETGFKKGDSILQALTCNFRKYISIDIKKEYFNKQKDLLNTYKNILSYYVGDSASQLKTVLKPDLPPAVIFLDAHGHNAGRCPLIGELQAILSSGRTQDIIIIDDAYFILTASENPNRAPWANEVGGLENIITLLKKIHGKDARINRIPYYKGPWLNRLRRRFPDHSEGGKNFTLVSQKK
tara:strand:- start:1300 stop:1908 length:609 start_codon:yes stop_codon:yes gene_type:complete